MLFRLLLFTAAILISGISNAVAQQDKVCVVETREYPGKDPYMWNGLYAATSGDVYSCLITEGESSHFYVYDKAQDKNIMLSDMAEFMGERGKGVRVSGKLHNKPVEDSEGNIYIVPMNNGSGPSNFRLYKLERRSLAEV